MIQYVSSIGKWYYYSQHDVDNGPKPKPGERSSEIYLTEIELC